MSMQQLALFMRDIDPADLATIPEGRMIIVDASPASLDGTAAPVISPLRVHRSAMLAAAARYEALFGLPESGTGAEAAAAMQRSIGEAWDAYRDGGEGDPLGFRNWLDGRDDFAAARTYVDGLRGLFADVTSMGVTKVEMEGAIDAVLGPVTPATMPREDLETVILGVRSL